MLGNFAFETVCKSKKIKIEMRKENECYEIMIFLHRLNVFSLVQGKFIPSHCVI